MKLWLQVLSVSPHHLLPLRDPYLCDLRESQTDLLTNLAADHLGESAALVGPGQGVDLGRAVLEHTIGEAAGG